MIVTPEQREQIAVYFANRKDYNHGYTDADAVIAILEERKLSDTEYKRGWNDAIEKVLDYMRSERAKFVVK